MECIVADDGAVNIVHCRQYRLSVLTSSQPDQHETFTETINHFSLVTPERGVPTVFLIVGNKLVVSTFTGGTLLCTAVQSIKDTRCTCAWWSSKSSRWLLSSDDGFSATEVVTDPTQIQLSKQKYTIKSDIGPQNRQFIHCGKSTIRTVYAVCGETDDIVIISCNHVTGLAAVTWATVDFANGSITLSWTMHTSESSLVVAARPSVLQDRHRQLNSGSKMAWSCLAVEGQVWIVTEMGIVGKFALDARGPATAILITSEEEIAGGDGGSCQMAATVLLCCADGVFLFLTLLVSQSTTSVQSVQRLRYRSLLHNIPGTENKQLGTLLPYLTRLCLWPGGIEQEGGMPPPVLVGYHERFGPEMIVLDTENLGIDFNTIAAFARQLRCPLDPNRVLLSGKSLDNPSRAAAAIALCQHGDPSGPCGRAAVLRLALHSVALHPAPRDRVAVDLTELPATALTGLQVLSADSVLCLTSRSLSQSTLFALHRRTSATALVAYDGDYITNEPTLGLFGLQTNRLVQVTPTIVAVLGESASTRRVDIGTLLGQAAAASVSWLTESNTASIKSSLASKGNITFAAALTEGFIALALSDVVLVVNAAANGTPQVAQVVQLASEACGLAATRPAAIGAAVLSVATWDGAVTLMRADAGGQLSRIHGIESTAGGGPTRTMAVTTVYASSELAVHALICGVGDQVLIYHAITSNSGTTVSLARTLTVGSPVVDVVILSPDSEVQSGPGAVSVYVRAIRGDYAVSCDISLLDGCERQVPFIEWLCAEVVHPIGAPLPTSVFPLSQGGEKGTAHNSEVPIGWLAVLRDGDSANCAAQLEFGSLAVTCPGALVTAKADLAGVVSSFEISPDERHVAVLSSLEPLQGQVGGHAVVRRGELAILDARSLQRLHRGPVPQVGVGDGRGLIAALWGPQPDRPAGTAVPNEDMFLSLVHAVMPQESHSDRPAGIVVQTVRYGVGNSDGHVGDQLPTGDIVGAWTLQPSPAESPTLSAAAVAAGELRPLQSTLFHVKTLSKELLVVCLADNILRLVGWSNATTSSSSYDTAYKLQELSSATLESRGSVVVDMCTVMASRVLVSVALGGIEVYTLVAGSRRLSGAATIPVLQYTHHVANTSAIWTDLRAREGLDAAGNGDCAVAATDRISGKESLIKLWIPSDTAALTGESLRCTVSERSADADEHSGEICVLSGLRKWLF